NGRVVKISVDRESAPMSFSEVVWRWQGDASFRAFFSDFLADAPFTAFRWETPPITVATVNQRPFEFVLLNSPELSAESDPAAFAKHFSTAPANETVVSFPNLGNDALLVVPCPGDKLSGYAHLAAFVRQAPEAQKHALWVNVAKAMERQLGQAPIWLSTAGAGVAWLHVRIDKRPKYYGH